MSRLADDSDGDGDAATAAAAALWVRNDGEIVLSVILWCAFGGAWRGDCCGVGSALSKEGETGADEAVSAVPLLPPPGNPVLG